MNRPRLLAGKLGAVLIITAIATGYTLLCILGIGTIALALGLLLPHGHGPEGLGVTVAFVVAGSIVSAHEHDVAVILPMYYWQDRAALFAPTGIAEMASGIACQVAALLRST